MPHEAGGTEQNGALQTVSHDDRCTFNRRRTRHGGRRIRTRCPSVRALRATSGTPIKIGYIENAVSLGAGSVNPYTIPAFQAWAKWQNANGGINGHPVEVVVQREPDNPGIAMTDVQNLVHQGIVALVSDDTQDETAWEPFVAKDGIPMFEATSGSVNLATSPLGFSTQVSLLDTPAAIVAAAAKAGSKEMAVLYCGEIPECAQAVPALAGAGKAIGVNVAFSSSILGSAPNYTAQCLTAKAHNATSLEVADASQIIIRVAASCARAGLHAPRNHRRTQHPAQLRRRSGNGRPDLLRVHYAVLRHQFPGHQDHDRSLQQVRSRPHQDEPVTAT